MSGLSEILSNLSIVIPSVVILTSLAMLINIATSTENLPHVIHQSGCFTCVLSFLFFFFFFHYNLTKKVLLGF